MATVLQISDTHLRDVPHTPADNDPDASLLATIDAIRDVRADLVLLTGDLADDGSQAALLRLHAVVDDLAAPVLAVAGNHDDLDNVRSVFGTVDTIEVGRWRVMGVESIIPGQDHGSVDVEQLTARLDRLDDRPTLLGGARPASPRRPSTGTWGWCSATAADDGCDRPHVRAIVGGHLHEVFDRHEGDVQIYGGPSSWYAIEHTGDDYRLFTDGLVGSQVLTLGDDGSFACNRVSRSLGC